MPRLNTLTLRTRLALLAEAAAKSKGVKDAKASEDIAGDCLKAANAFRDAAKAGESLEMAADKVAKDANQLSAGTKGAVHDVEAATKKMKDAVDGIYGDFATARQAFYAVALAWDMYAKQPSAGKKSASTDIKTQSDKEVSDAIVWSAKNLTTSVNDFLNKAMKASNLLRAAAKTIGLEKGELNDSQKKALIDACFDAKNAADPLFGRVAGINRRVVELLARAQEKAKYEAKARGVEIKLAFEDDDELGDLEIL
jgi:hypothetical protein